MDLANANALQDSTFITGGNLQFDPSVSGHAFAFGGLSGSGSLALFDIANNPVALTVGNNNQSTTYSGNIYTGPAGSSFTKVGSGILTFGGTLNGAGMVISGGTLALGNYGALGNSTVTMNGGVLGFGTLPQPNFIVPLGGLSGAGALTLTDDSSQPVVLYVGGNNQSTTYSGVLGGSGSLTKVGSGTLTLSGANTFTGATTLIGGTLKLDNGTPLPPGLPLSTVDMEGGSLAFGASTMIAQIGGLTGSGNIQLVNQTSQGVVLQVGSNNQSTTYSGTLSGQGTLTKVGSGTLTLAGANFQGTTFVDQGPLVVTGSLANNGSASVHLLPLGGGLPGLPPAFTASIIRLVGAGASYAGFGSAAIDSNGVPTTALISLMGRTPAPRKCSLCNG